ncbi:MAG: RluA family pseudouridine synthase [Cyanobacteria bacterium M_surface_10_m2_119]|nr:RluA family pseudouridine synthase [Cyanobacteria bacterium M_surface_10_m2_119]
MSDRGDGASAVGASGFGEGEGELLTLTYPRPLPMRLDRWLVAQRPEQSRSRIQKFIDAGYVRVNGVTGRAKTPLRHGDTVELWMPPPEPLPYLVAQAMPLDVLFEDEHLIVLNKPAGLTVHPAPGNKDGTLVNGLLHHCPDLPGIGGELRPGIVHRLDKDTTGCIVVAKSQEALVKLQVQIQKRIASREYLAVVHGQPAADSGTVVGAIGRHPSDRKKYAVVSDGSGRHACTHWRVIERLGDYAMLRFKLDTGRTHQIRVHCAHMNHPIVGDPTYSRARRLPVELPGQALHAVQLGLDHPISGERIVCEAPLPPPFDKLLAALRRRTQTGAALPPSARSMAEQNLQAFIVAVQQDPDLQQQLSTTAAADADEVAGIARSAGFEVRPGDLVAFGGGALVDYEDEDYFMKPRWWTLAS